MKGERRKEGGENEPRAENLFFPKFAGEKFSHKMIVW